MTERTKAPMTDGGSSPADGYVADWQVDLEPGVISEASVLVGASHRMLQAPEDGLPGGSLKTAGYDFDNLQAPAPKRARITRSPTTAREAPRTIAGRYRRPTTDTGSSLDKHVRAFLKR